MKKTQTASNSLASGTVYARLDDALRAASCLCGLAANGATIYGTTDGLETARHGADCLATGEAYMVAVATMDSAWPVPPSPFEPIYTITRKAGR